MSRNPLATPTTEFGRVLRHARIELGRTVVDMAAEIPVKPSHLSFIELGSRCPRRRLLDRVIAAYRLHAPSTVALWLRARCAHDRVLRHVGERPTFMQQCRRRRVELGLTTAAVAASSGVSNLTMRERGKRLPPRPDAARRLCAVLGLPESLAQLAERERIAHRLAVFLPADASRAAVRRVTRERARRPARRTKR